MKKLLLFFPLFILWVHVHAQRHWTPVDEKEVPKAVIDAAKEQKPDAKHFIWGMRYAGTSLVYQAHGMDEAHPFSVQLDKTGKVVGTIKNIQHHEVPEPVKAKVDEYVKKGWKLNRVYHKVYNEKNTYKLFFDKEAKQHLKVVMNEKGKVKKTHIQNKEHENKHVTHH